MAEASLVGLLIRVAVTLAVFWLTSQLLIRVVAAAARRAGVTPGQVRLIEEGIASVFVVLAIIALVHLSGLTSEFTALTISGIAAIVLSLALQATLSNMISGILLLLDNTLRVNDLIEYSGAKGEVVKIGLRNTWVKTAEGNVVVISNSQLANGPLINYTAGERLLRKL
ncbi:MAG: mechanosensitive ion channel domain-containing protein [Candidatus Bathyarchaeia archaeon]